MFYVKVAEKSKSDGGWISGRSREFIFLGGSGWGEQSHPVWWSSCPVCAQEGRLLLGHADAHIAYESAARSTEYSQLTNNCARCGLLPTSCAGSYDASRPLVPSRGRPPQNFIVDFSPLPRHGRMEVHFSERRPIVARLINATSVRPPVQSTENEGKDGSLNY